MKDYIKKAQENETIIDGGKVYDELRRDYLNRSFLFLAQMKKQMMILILSVTKHILK
ncbi:hypothetical protein NCW68_08950 [Klebsiella pneumoniae]|uniref:hypothetical protein n=1 Tax=Klebsiella pneumoniae TaxID=573 RepID=UPI002938EAAF|nr:hypothetical protein [Klebsiella pneumoniae]WOF57190.1 hypothetical protein NCW68_08950 [Klebsiella pneumoniae]